MATASESVDAVVVGGGYAGLAAALYLGRARRSVVVVDAGEPRNRFARASHGFLGRDGAEPSAILADARRQIAFYATVQLVGGRVARVERAEEGFRAHLESGAAIRSRRVVLATGVVDRLPDLPGCARGGAPRSCTARTATDSNSPTAASACSQWGRAASSRRSSSPTGAR